MPRTLAMLLLQTTMLRLDTAALPATTPGLVTMATGKYINRDDRQLLTLQSPIYKTILP